MATFYLIFNCLSVGPSVTSFPPETVTLTDMKFAEKVRIMNPLKYSE